MDTNITRRDLLKLLSAYGSGLMLPRLLHQAPAQQNGQQNQNVLIIVFDAWSGQNISLYGYPRRTTPYIDKLAEKAIVYHNHFAGGNYTTPGTASLLTGTLPWTHRAINHNDEVKADFSDKSIFHAFPNHHRMAYSHNLVVNIFLRQFFRGIDDYTSWEKLYLESDLLPSTLFKNDEDIATVGWERAIKKNDGYSYMLFLSRIYEYLKKFSRNELSDQFPRGLPNFASSNSFILEDGVDWLQRSILEAPKPYLAYYHFLPPHFPYNTRIDFFQQFENDGYRPVDKPEHEYFAKDRTQEYLFESRQSYDEFILYCDEEFHRLYRFLDNQGFLENTWLVLTSDHGEMFERGIGGHITPVLYNPLMRIPLLIFPPGQQERIDIQTNTSAIDILPTLTHLTGQKIPEWTEGHVLPPFNINYEGDPPDVYGVRGRGIDKSQPINRGTFMIIRENFKGVFYLGYDGKAEKWGDYVEVFDIENDPEELENLAEVQPGITRDFSDTLLSQLEEKNKDYN